MINISCNKDLYSESTLAVIIAAIAKEPYFANVEPTASQIPGDRTVITGRGSTVVSATFNLG